MRADTNRANRRYTLACLLALGAAAHWRSVMAQARPKRVAFVSLAASKDQSFTYQAVCSRLAESGWIEGKTISYDWAFVAGKPDRNPGVIAELLGLRPDALVVGDNYGARAALAITRTTPIVVFVSLDPIGAGIAQSLARSARNVTGAMWADPGTAAKIVDMARETLPAMRRLAVLYDKDYPGMRPYIEADRAAAKALGIDCRDYVIRGTEDLAAITDALKKDRIDAVKAAFGGRFNLETLSRVIEESSKHKVAVVCPLPTAADLGALLTYGPSLPDLAGAVAGQLDKILRGSKVEEMPFEYAKRMELVVNVKAAKRLGVSIPQSILARADRIVQ